MKKSIKIITISAITLCLIAVIVLASSVLSSKAESGTLSVSDETLYKYEGTDTRVTVPSGVKTIGKGAFEDCDSIEVIYLPSSLETIEYNAFAEMDSLKRIQIPDSVTFIGTGALANCPNLTSVEIGKGVEKLGSGVFSGCNSLKKVSLNENNKYLSYSDGVLYNADKSTIYAMMPGREKISYVMNNNVNFITPYSFYGVDALEHVALSSNLTDVSPYAFSGADSLKSVTIGFNTKTIDINAFENCTSLEQIHIPDSVTAIHPSSFDGCTNIGFYAPEFSVGYNYALDKGIPILNNPIYDLNIAESTKYDKKETSEPKEETEGNTVTINGVTQVIKPEVEEERVPDGPDVLASTQVVNSEAVVLLDVTQPKVVSSNGIVEYGNVLEDYLEDGVIPDNLYYMKKDLKTISIPEGIKEIGSFSFARSGIQNVVIPEGVTTIGKGAFYHCDDLKDVSIPSTVTDVGEHAFEHTAFIQDYYDNGTEDYLIIGDGILIAYRCDDKDFKLPSNVKKVACQIPTK